MKDIFAGCDVEVALSRFMDREFIFRPSHLTTIKYDEARTELESHILNVIRNNSPQETSKFIASIFLNALEGAEESKVSDLIAKIF